MEDRIYHIYDKIFKKVLTLSSRAVVNLVNGLFDTQYAPDSTIDYNWTEFVDDKLKRILADTIITINGTDSYHLEAQMTRDDSILVRVFEYGVAHALRHSVQKDDWCEIIFPEPKVIYLCPQNDIPEQYTLRIIFGNQGHFDYRVGVVCFNDISTEEVNRRKMVILIPFKLLKLRKELLKSRNKDNLTALKKLIQNDIIGSIEENLDLGNITIDDARKLKRYTHFLYQQIYSHYEEMEELNEVTDESLMLDIDYIEKEYEEKLAAIEAKKAIAEQKVAVAEEKIAKAQEKAAEAEGKIAEAEEKAEAAAEKAAEAEEKATVAEEKATAAAEKAAEAEARAEKAEAEIVRLKALLAEKSE